VKGDTGRRRRPANDTELQAIARAFVEARLNARPLRDYPGKIPADLDTAYRCQDMAIDLWPDEVAGWKVGRIPAEIEKQFGCDRLAGPIFRKTIHRCDSDAVLDLPAFPGGFAAIEAEFVIVVDSDAPADKLRWSRDEARQWMGDLRIGIEMASSPLKTINDLGPAVIASDFGNNAGLIVGPSIEDWGLRKLESLTCEAFIEGKSVGKGGACNLTGGPLRSLQFILELAARRGRPLKAGDVIATGQTSGIHDIATGETGRIDFGRDGVLTCRAIAAQKIGYQSP
jgi:2-keto-4-pentenoate hydratase